MGLKKYESFVVLVNRQVKQVLPSGCRVFCSKKSGRDWSVLNADDGAGPSIINTFVIGPR